MNSLNIDECFPCYADEIPRTVGAVSDADDENKQAEGKKRPMEKMVNKHQTQLRCLTFRPHTKFTDKYDLLDQ